MPEMTRQQLGAYVAWEEYYAQMARLHRAVRRKGNGPWDHKYSAQFEWIAKYCAKAGIGVRQYVETVIAVLLGTDIKYITPATMAQPHLVELVAKMLDGASSPSDWNTYWTTMLCSAQRLAVVCPEAYPDIAAVLMVPTTGFDAWFRVMAVRPFNEELFEAYGKAAHAELQGSRTLRDFLRKVAPENMAELERRIARFGDS